MIKKIIKSFAILILFIVVFLTGFSYVKLQSILSAVPEFDINKIYVNESTKVYDKNQNLIVELGVEKRDVVQYDAISQTMIDAIISIEDERFFEHRGLDYKRIIGALIENVKEQSFAEGASTITQQLVKLSYLTNEKTLDRKIKEMVISVKLEENLSKEEILEAYLNKVLFGGRIYGVEKASQYYFNKSVSEINFEEAALLAGMVQSPNRFNPYTQPVVTKARQIVVLNAMLKNNKITPVEAKIGIDRPLEELIIKQINNIEHEKYYEYIDYVIYELQNKYQINPLVESLKIYTYLDTTIQDHIYKVENSDQFHPNDRTQTGIIVMETQTGILRAIGGGRNYQGALSFNFALDAKRQPGSTIKPILDFGPAIEYLNYSPGQPFLDEKIYFGTMGSRFVPVENYDHKYKGYMTMRDAIIDSRNVTAVKAYREVGEEKAYAFANNLGLVVDEPITEAHAIGGFSYGFTVLDMTAAYSAFGNQGIYNEPTSIDYIIQNNNKVDFTNHSVKAMKESTAYLMTDILHENMNIGTATSANVSGLILAGKTGQTNYTDATQEAYGFPSNSVRDSWFIGYSTKYTTGVWLGYDKIEKGAYLTPVQAKNSLEMFKSVMQEVHINPSDSVEFERPDNIVEVEIETNVEPLFLPSEYTPHMYKRKELFIEGTEPTSVSNRFKPLDMPSNFIAYYDDEKETVHFKWDKFQYDYSQDDFIAMEQIHRIVKFYDYEKDKLLQEYNKRKNDNFVPTFITDGKIRNLFESYCSQENRVASLCNINNVKTFKQYVSLLEELKNYEINSMLNNREIDFLTEGQLAELRGYRVWNGFSNGLYSNLGNIEYKIVGLIGMEEKVIYSGPYLSEVSKNLSLEEYINYDGFYIIADYTKYRYYLQSQKNFSFNPFFNFD
ncbi:MAG: hypothetical protein K0Q49_56 [Haloplasmataceae bacterium]|nr:hypothetical protein [Haloplasmataceae bacterium]